MVFTVTLYYILTVKNLLRVSTRVPVHCLMYRHAQGNITLSGNRLWRFVNMCSRIMTLVFTVTLQILTVRNCTESRTDVPVHCLMHCRTLHRVGTGLRRGYWSDKGKKTKNSWYTSWRWPCCGRPRHWCLPLWLSGSLGSGSLSLALIRAAL